MIPTDRLATILEGSRVSRRRRDELRSLVEELWASAERARTDAGREAQTVRDLRRHLRDRDRHIKNLEAEVRGRMGVA